MPIKFTPTKGKTKPTLKKESSTIETNSLGLADKYRPRSFDAVVGQDVVVKSLKTVLASKSLGHAFMFAGPSGVGKTTLARIVAVTIGISRVNVIEVDAASNTGIDNMRNITNVVQYRALRGDSDLRFVIIDEAHRLSKPTFDSLLKILEEPPPHVYWALSTTEPDKVPETVRQRCYLYTLNEVPSADIEELLTKVNEKEGLGVSDEIIGVLSRNVGGSPRRALTSLAQVVGITDKKQALRTLENGVGEEQEAIALARLLCIGQGRTWEKCTRIIAGLDKDSAEGVRLIVVNYASAMLKGAKDPIPLLDVLDKFQGPYNASEHWAPFYLSMGRLLFDQT